MGPVAVVVGSVSVYLWFDSRRKSTVKTWVEKIIASWRTLEYLELVVLLAASISNGSSIIIFFPADGPSHPFTSSFNNSKVFQVSIPSSFSSSLCNVEQTAIFPNYSNSTCLQGRVHHCTSQTDHAEEELSVTNKITYKTVRTL